MYNCTEVIKYNTPTFAVEKRSTNNKTTTTMKTTTILKTILLATAMMLGSEGWAQTTLYYRTLTGTESADAAEQAWSPSDIGTGKWVVTVSGSGSYAATPEIDNDRGLNLPSKVRSQEIAYSTLGTSELVKMTVDAVWNIGLTDGNNNSNYTYFRIGSDVELRAYIRSSDNRAAYLAIKNGDNWSTTSIPNAIQGDNRNDDEWTIHAEINTYTKKLTALTIKGTKGETKVDYTISDQKSLTSTATFGSIAIGAVRGGGSIGTSLKSIKVSEEPLLAYSVHWKSGDTDMGEFTSGYDVNGASVSIPYYGYLCKDNVLYKNSTFVGSKTFTLTENPQTEYITSYTAQNVGFVVYCEEAENIGGMTLANTNAMGSRCSGKQSAYCTEDVTITTLPAGTYNITAGIQGNGTSTFVFKAGETTILTLENESSSYREEKSTGTFTIDVTTDIKVNGGSSSVAFDNFYIVCTSGRVASVDDLGYTFSSTLPLDFTGTTVEAYTAAYNSTTKKVDLTRVYKVPANTGLFIKGTADDIPVLTGDADVIGTNNLVAVSSATTVAAIDGSNTNYVLALADKDDESKGVVFLKADGTTNIPAGKAYLQIPTASAPTGDAPQLMLSFNDVFTTGINKVQGDGFKANGYYDLQGRKVSNPTKGLYIVNGKKVVIK